MMLSQIKLGTMYHRCGRLSDAEAILRESLSVLQQYHIPDNSATLDCLSSLAFLLRQRGNLDEADAMLRCALEGSGRVYGLDHPKTILVQNNYASLLMSRAAIAEAASEASAIELYADAELRMRDALSRELSSIGESDPLTQQTMHNLAALLHARQSDSDEALGLMRRAVRSRSASLGISNANTIASRSALITMLLKRGQEGLSEAEDLMRSMIFAAHANIDEWIKVRSKYV
jgi:tetratricopeptide (TPR) repeat protein